MTEEHTLTLTYPEILPEGSVIRMSDGSYWRVDRRIDSITYALRRPPWVWRCWWAIRDFFDDLFTKGS
jgi:hypothetical protein